MVNRFTKLIFENLNFIKVSNFRLDLREIMLFYDVSCVNQTVRLIFGYQRPRVKKDSSRASADRLTDINIIGIQHEKAIFYFPHGSAERL